MTTKPKFYITTAIAYVNDVPHLGHALEAIGTDVQARYRRMLGYDVMFLTGTDEHGQKVATNAEKNGVTPKEWADRNAKRFQEAFDKLAISYDDFIRTTEERHHATVKSLWKVLFDQGDIYLGKYEGWYDVKEESFITETEMKEQGLEADNVRIKRMSEDSYFFKLSKYRDQLLEYYEAHPEAIAPEYRRNEVLNSFLRGDIPDLCISRTSITWGIDAPDAPGHVVYVWFDALTNYITGTGYGTDEAKYQKWWPADVHVIGKDILKFHCVYWPAFLMAAGIPVAKQVFAHGFINVIRPGSDTEEKMSKSAGNAIDPLAYVDKIGCEPLRYLLMRDMNFGSDGVFNENAMIDRYNSELPNGLGNTLSRTANLIAKNFGTVSSIPADELTEMEKEFGTEWDKLVAIYEEGMPRFEFYAILGKIAAYQDMLNRRINEMAPWKMAKDPEQADRLRVFLVAVAESIRGIATLLKPFMPESSRSVLETLGVDPELPWEKARKWGESFQDVRIEKPSPLFQKLEP